MAGFVAGVERGQCTLFPASLDDYVAQDNPVRAVDVFVDGLDLGKLGFGKVQPLATEDPAIAEILAFIGDGKHRALCLPADDRH